MEAQGNTRWTAVQRHLPIPISGDGEIDSMISSYASRIEQTGQKDYRINHNCWEALEHLCRHVNLIYGPDLETYDCSGPYLVSDIVVRAVNDDLKEAPLYLKLSQKYDACVWSRETVVDRKEIQTLVRWHLNTNLLTSVTVIRRAEFFDSRNREYRINQYRHMEDGLSELIIDVFRTLKIPEYLDDLHLFECVWGNEEDD